MKSKHIVGWAVVVLVLVQAGPVAGGGEAGGFVPGHVFVSQPSPKLCMNGDIFGWDRIIFWAVRCHIGKASLAWVPVWVPMAKKEWSGAGLNRRHTDFQSWCLGSLVLANTREVLEI